jgi:hypothetical protein
VRDAIASLGLIVVDAVRSPLRGPAGNVEVFFRTERMGKPVADATLAEAAQ